MILAGSIRHADVLLVSGIPNWKNTPRVKKLYSQVPKPCPVIAIGSCALGRGIFDGTYNSPKCLDEVIPVDAYIPGCPPKPEAIIAGVVKVLEKLKSKKV